MAKTKCPTFSDYVPVVGDRVQVDGRSAVPGAWGFFGRVGTVVAVAPDGSNCQVDLDATAELQAFRQVRFFPGEVSLLQE